MKTKLFLLLLLVSVAVVSCNKDKTTDNQGTVSSSLPTKAATYIDTNYPDASIETVVTVSNSDAKYLVTLNTAEELAFDGDGGYLGYGDGFHNGQTMCDTIVGGHHGGHHDGIPADSLSTIITDYIAANYPDYEILHAMTKTICPEGDVIEVVIGMPETEPVKLYFGVEGAFLFTSARIEYTATPQPVQDYITTNYPGYEVCNRAEQLTLPENVYQYMVHMRLENVKQQVRMDEVGTLVCASEADTIPDHHGGHHGGHH
jgi:hypothetical protein